MRAALGALILAFLGAALAAPIGAVEPGEMLKDPALEQRARGLSKRLRCLVCQNQSIDESNADLARDLRLLVRKRLVAGDSDAKVIAFVRQRYGDFVLLRPPVQPSTYLLWFGPALLLLIAGSILVLRTRRRGAEHQAKPKPLSKAERARLKTILGDDADGA